MEPKKSPSILEDLEREDDRGSLTKPLHIDLSGIPNSDPKAAHRDSWIVGQLPFKGRYQTWLKNGRLYVPKDYHELLKFGGAVTPGLGNHLYLFGNKHWSRMIKMLSDQVGFDIGQNNLVRHVHGRAMEFDRLEADGSIILRDDLIKFANLKDEIIMVGVIYYAEVHDRDAYFASEELNYNDVQKLVQALA